MANSNAYAQYFQKGVELYAAGHYEEALTALKKVIVLQPDFPDAYFKIACIYSELDRFADAFSMFEKVCELLPNDLEVFWMYGRNLLRAGEEKKGFRILKKALKLNPRDPRCRMEMARYYVQKDKVKKAISILEAGIKSNSDHAPFFAMTGDLYRKQRKYAKAQNYFEQCLEIDPDNETAKRGFNAVIRAEESDDGSRGALSPEEDAREEMVEVASLYAEGKYDQAIVRLLDLKERPGVEREASMLLGLAFARKGLYKRAHDVLLAFTRDHAADILVWYNLGLAANRMGRYEQAIEYLAEALEQDEDFEEALIEMGIACQMTGEIPHAQRYFLRALKMNRNDARPYAYLARMAFDRDERDKVDEFLKRGQQCGPGHPSLHLLKGYAAVVEGEYELAVEELTSCLEKAPDHFEALKLIGRAKLEMHDMKGGLESYQAAAGLNPGDVECRQVLQELANHNK